MALNKANNNTAFKTIVLLAVMLFSTFIAYTPQANAHPYYAINMGYNRCTTCHVTPVGGGMRHLDGKYYGFRNLKPSPWGKQDLISADVRALYYYPEKVKSSKDGSGVMAINLGANIPLSEVDFSRGSADSTSTDTTDTRFVIEHNLGGFPGGGGGPRDTYVRWQFYNDTEYHLYPQFIQVGRFRSPFGLPTDEHRTYTKIQTKNTWNDYDMGALAAGDFGSTLHYDLAIANGTKTGGVGLNDGVATHWGTSANLRWAPSLQPIYLGASAAYYEAEVAKNSPTAFAAYTVISIARLTVQRVRATLLAEYVEAEDWNSSVSDNFFTDPAYKNSVLTSKSQGWWGQLNYDFTDYFTLQYKYDQYVPDRDFPSDFYERHGVGFRYRQTAHLSVLARTEWARATHPSESAGTGTGAKNATLILLMMNL